MGRRMTAFLMTVCILVSVFQGMYPPETVSAKEVYRTGRLPVEEREAELNGGEALYISGEESLSPEAGFYRAAVYQSEWDKYKTYYFYNQLSGPEKAYWDGLDQVCSKYLLTPCAPEYYAAAGAFYTTPAGSDSLELTRMKELLAMFRYTNPQYYFLNNVTWTLTSGGKKYLAFGVYTAFADGGARAAATEAVKAQANAWQSQIDACPSDAEKVRLIHDLIVQKVDYNEEIYDTEHFDENTAYTQSAYSVFCKDTTVCAGYAQAFEMMCNGSGIDAVAVTSPDHEWNKVRIDDSWYNVDCTWADMGRGGISYLYFERNDLFYDRDGSTAHSEEDFWLGYLPVCSLDTGSTDAAPGPLPVITQRTPEPEILVEFSGGGVIVTLSSSHPDAVIYYSLNGEAPSPSAGKCSRYYNPFSADKAAVIRAVAVCDAKRDSGVAEVRPESLKSCVVTYDGNGAVRGSMAAQEFLQGMPFVTGVSLFERPGYTFCGWNTAADGSGTFYAEGGTVRGVDKDLTLYACWEPVTYRITYNLDGGTNACNPVSYTCEDETIILKAPSKEGCVFDGWYADGAFSTEIQTIEKGSTGDRELYARWLNKIGNGGENTENAAAQNHLADARVILTETEYYYNGKAKKPAVIVISGRKTLVSGRDYTVAYRNNKMIGTATVLIAGKGAYSGSAKAVFSIRAKKGTEFTSGGYRYTVTGSSQVAFAGIKNTKTTNVKIPATVKYGGKRFQVTSVAARALCGNTKVRTVTAGNNVKTIGSRAFSGCTKLSSVTLGTGLTGIGSEAFSGCGKLNKLTIKSSKLKSVGKNALRGIDGAAKIRVPAKKLGDYKKLFRGKGQGRGVKIVKTE